MRLAWVRRASTRSRVRVAADSEDQITRAMRAGGSMRSGSWDPLSERRSHASVRRKSAPPRRLDGAGAGPVTMVAQQRLQRGRIVLDDSLLGTLPDVARRRLSHHRLDAFTRFFACFLDCSRFEWANLLSSRAWSLPMNQAKRRFVASVIVWAGTTLSAD